MWPAEMSLALVSVRALGVPFIGPGLREKLVIMTLQTALVVVKGLH